MKFQTTRIAKINNSNIEIKPLTIFIGRNGTNKSYMAHLVYELYKELKKFKEDTFYQRSKTRINIINSFMAEFGSNITYLNNAIIDSQTVIEEEQIDFEEFEQIELLQNTYSLEKIRKLEKTLCMDIYNFILEYLIKKINKSYNTNTQIIDSLAFDFNYENIFSEDNIIIKAKDNNGTHNKFIRKIFSIVFNYFYKQIDANECFYFPSSRTGFVLAFDEIVSGVFRDRFGGQPTATKLTEPTIDFLSNFADIKTGKFTDDYKDFFTDRATSIKEHKAMTDLIQYLEQNILHGEILENKNEEDYTKYQLKTKDNTILDLHVTSSATIELLPLIVFLKHFKRIKDRLLVIEEPEAHLHPDAQIMMARFIVMLINNGAKVLITTHSDYMLREFSNCIYLNNSTSEFIATHNLDSGMGKKIHLNDEKVNVYLFKDLDKKVKINKLEIGEDGIPIDNFNQISDELDIIKNMHS